jgi:hypothetical protein
MTASIDSLRRQVAAMKAKLDVEGAPRQWSLCLEEGEELADSLKAQLGKHDTVYIRRFPAGLLGDRSDHGQVMSCWLPGKRGQKIPHVVREYGVEIGKV